MDIKKDLKKVSASEYVCGDFSILKHRNMFNMQLSWAIYYKGKHLVNAHNMQGVRDYLRHKIDLCQRSKRNS